MAPLCRRTLGLTKNPYLVVTAAPKDVSATAQVPPSSALLRSQGSWHHGPFEGERQDDWHAQAGSLSDPRGTCLVQMLGMSDSPSFLWDDNPKLREDPQVRPLSSRLDCTPLASRVPHCFPHTPPL